MKSHKCIKLVDDLLKKRYNQQSVALMRPVMTNPPAGNHAHGSCIQQTPAQDLEYTNHD